MSDTPTPRTDEEVRTEYDNQGDPYDDGIVDADFARQLERELAEMRDQRDAALETILRMKGDADE